MNCPIEGSGYCKNFNCDECTPQLMKERVEDLQSQLVDEAISRYKDDEACKRTRKPSCHRRKQCEETLQKEGVVTCINLKIIDCPIYEK